MDNTHLILILALLGLGVYTTILISRLAVMRNNALLLAEMVKAMGTELIELGSTNVVIHTDYTDATETKEGSKTPPS